MANDLSLGAFFLKTFPHLKKDLKKANMKISPLQFLNKATRNGLVNGLGLTALAFFVLSRAQKSILLLVPIFFVLFFMFFMLDHMKVKAAINRRRKEIDQDVIFVGRYLLIKLYSGKRWSIKEAH